MQFDWGTFDTSNPGAFKYAFMHGLDPLGYEVFELLWGSGSLGPRQYAHALICEQSDASGFYRISPQR